MENKNDNAFQYTYSAPTQEERMEINSIRQQYDNERMESKLDRLRKLDARVKVPAMVWALSLGIVGCLIFGGGMALILELGATRVLWSVIGIFLCIFGAVPIGLAYPVYNRILRRNKKKYGKEILRLSDELLREYDENS